MLLKIFILSDSFLIDFSYFSNCCKKLINEIMNRPKPPNHDCHITQLEIVGPISDSCLSPFTSVSDTGYHCLAAVNESG